MKITQSFEIKHSILVNDKLVKDLVEYLQTKYTTVRIIIECSDGSTRNPDDLDDFLNFDNADHHKIERLSIFGYASSDNTIYIRFFSGKFSDSAAINIESNDTEKPIILKDWIIDKLRGARFPWFHNFASQITLEMVSVSRLIVGGTGWLYLKLNGIKTSKSNMDAGDLLYSSIIGGIIMLSLSYLHRWIFPRIFFSLNYGKERLSRIYSARNFIFMTVIFSIILKVVTGIVTEGMERFIHHK